MNIRIETFKQDGTHTTPMPKKCAPLVSDVGWVDVDLGNEVVTVRASRRVSLGKVQVSVAGFVGRYETSNKPWPAHVWQVEGEEGPQATFGRDDRSGRFHKLRGISYEPDTYATLANMPFWYSN